MSIPGRGNTSKKPDGKPQGQVVSFTRGAADRIAKVVRTVERGDTSAEGLRFTRVGDGGPGAKAIRVVTFTGSWSKDSAKVVTFKFQTTTPNTVSATNLLCAIDGDTASTSASTVAIIGKDGTAWYYVNHECNTSTCTLTLGGFDVTQISGYNAGEIQLLGHDTGDTEQYGEGYDDDECEGPSLRWFSITTCATATASP